MTLFPINRQHAFVTIRQTGLLQRQLPVSTKPNPLYSFRTITLSGLIIILTLLLFPSFTASSTVKSAAPSISNFATPLPLCKGLFYTAVICHLLSSSSLPMISPPLFGKSYSSSENGPRTVVLPIQSPASMTWSSGLVLGAYATAMKMCTRGRVKREIHLVDVSAETRREENWPARKGRSEMSVVESRWVL